MEGTHVALKQSRKSVPAVAPASTSTSDITPRLLTVKQAAAYTGATVWHVRELYWAQAIAGFVAGRRLLLDRTSLDAWIDRRLAERAA
jgi:excisionase family DNA binding protein